MDSKELADAVRVVNDATLHMDDGEFMERFDRDREQVEYVFADVMVDYIRLQKVSESRHGSELEFVETALNKALERMLMLLVVEDPKDRDYDLIVRYMRKAAASMFAFMIVMRKSQTETETAEAETAVADQD